MRAFVVGCVFVVAACAIRDERRAFVGPLPPHTSLSMTGSFTFSPEGELRLALTVPCTVDSERLSSGTTLSDRCGRSVLDQIRVIAHAPWGMNIRATWNDPGHLVFPVDWKASGLDPLADDAATMVAGPWLVSGTQWTPTPTQARAILRLVSEATETETELVQGGPAPALEVTTFEIDGSTLHTSDPNTLVVRIANHGPGTAYRVAATTRSSIEALHGRRLSFGLIKPGADKVRRLTLTVPASESAPDTMLVLVVAEGNGFAPHNVSRRVPIAPSAAAPRLAVRCTILDHAGPRPYLDAGHQITLRCTVDNTGDAAAGQVSVEASIADNAPARSAIQAIAAGSHASFEVSILVPRVIPIDSPVAIAVMARDSPSSRSARTTMTGVVRKPRLCVAGQLTRAQYRAKLAELRAAVAAGDLTQAQLDRYDAELVACLQ